jgi:O-antigen ligase
LLIAWGAFAFGAVYPWAYRPLAIGSAIVGLAGLVTGSRPALSCNKLLFAALAGIAAVAVLQLVPLPVDLLSKASPGTATFLANYDFRFSLGVDPTGGSTAATLRHSISIAPGATWLFLQLFAAAFLLFAGLLRVLSRTGAVRLARGIAFIGFVLALVGIVQKATLGDHAWGGMKIYGFWEPAFKLSTPFGPFVNKNHFAGWMLMGIPMALSQALAQSRLAHRPRRGLRDTLLWLSEPEGGRMLLYLVMSLVMILSLLMAGSRSGLACVAVTLLAMAVSAGRRTSRRTAAAMAAAILLLLLLGLQWAGRDARLERFAADSESLSMRLTIWQVAAGIVREFPVFGTGLNTFGSATILYQPPGSDLHYSEAHNDYLQLLVEGGIVSFLLLAVAIAALVHGTVGRMRAGDDGDDARWVRVGAVTGLVAVGLQALVEFTLQMPGNAVLFVVLMALALYVPAPHRKSSLPGIADIGATSSPG